jgi:hypothetical protein
MARPKSCKSQPRVAKPKYLRTSVVRFALVMVLASLSLPGAAADKPNPLKRSVDKGIFLVATEQLAHSSFKETVILITHHSEKGHWIGHKPAF